MEKQILDRDDAFLHTLLIMEETLKDISDTLLSIDKKLINIDKVVIDTKYQDDSIKSKVTRWLRTENK